MADGVIDTSTAGFSCGFFNSKNGDRVYDADDFSKLFGGLISDGVYKYAGGGLQVSAGEGELELNIESGQAYFLGHWIALNRKTVLKVQANNGDRRYVSVVLRVSNRVDERTAQIYLKYGSNSQVNPVKPSLENDTEVVEREIAYFIHETKVTNLKSAVITNNHGKTEFPYVTGYIESISRETTIRNWDNAFHEWWYEGGGKPEKDVGPKSEKGYEWQWTTWFQSIKDQWTQWYDNTKTAWDTWFANIKNEWADYKSAKDTDWTNYKAGKDTDWTNYKADKDTDWDYWFDNVKGDLSGDVAYNLSQKIDANTTAIDELDNTKPDSDDVEALIKKKMAWKEIYYQEQVSGSGTLTIYFDMASLNGKEVSETFFNFTINSLSTNIKVYSGCSIIVPMINGKTIINRDIPLVFKTYIEYRESGMPVKGLGTVSTIMNCESYDETNNRVSFRFDNTITIELDDTSTSYDLDLQSARLLVDVYAR